MENLKEKLLQQFSHISFDDWKIEAQKSIGDTSIDDLLSKKLTSNIEVKAIYDKSQVSQYFDLNFGKRKESSEKIFISDITNAYCEPELEVALIINWLKNSNEKYNTISLNIDSNFFLSIAKFRGARFLLNSELGDDVHIIAKSSNYNKSSIDIENNLVRLTLEAMSSIIGGADKVELTPYNSLAENNDFGARITDNIHKILENESYMGIVADPLSGSYLVENMTNEFVTAVRKILKDLSNNNIEEYIDKNSKAAIEKRKSDLDMQREKLIGVNIYQNHKNKLGSIDKSENRFAIPFEELKQRIDAVPPKIYVTNFDEPSVTQRNLVMTLNTFNIAFQIGGAFELVEDAYNSIKLYDPDLVVLNGNAEIARTLHNMLPEYTIVNIDLFAEKSILKNGNKILEAIEGGQ